MTTPYTPAIHTVQLTEEDISELKALLERIEQDEFSHRGMRTTDTSRSRDLLKQSLTRILNQIPRG